MGLGVVLDGTVNIIRAGTDLIYGLAQTAELGRLNGISPFKHTHTVMHFLVSDLISCVSSGKYTKTGLRKDATCLIKELLQVWKTK